MVDDWDGVKPQDWIAKMIQDGHTAIVIQLMRPLPKETIVRWFQRCPEDVKPQCRVMFKQIMEERRQDGVGEGEKEIQ